MTETRPGAERSPLFGDEGVSGVHLNELGPTVARRAAAALGLYLRRDPPEGDAPVVLLAGDDRPIMPELIAAAAEGLRWTGCHVVDLGRATAGCMGFAIGHFRADGGLLLGNPTWRQHIVGMKFWQRDGAPISSGGSLEAIREIFNRPMDRPTRRHGSLERFQVDEAYLAALDEHYHALRPPRLVLATACRGLVGYLARLAEPLGGRITLHEGRAERLSEMVCDEAAHFAARIDGDGELCDIWDERGQPVPRDRLLLLLASDLLRQRPGGTIVVEEGTAEEVVVRLAERGGRVARCGARRSDMHRRMRSEKALLGGGASGRLWHGAGEHFTADALWTLTRLLTILGQSDRSLSRVCDEHA